MHRPVLAAAIVVFPCLAGEPCLPVGSPLIDRPITDSSGGAVLIYRGDSAPAAGPAAPLQWSFFDDDSNGGYVTPLLFRVEGDSFVLVAMGTSRASNASGVQAHPFGLTAGDPTLETGAEYTFGFTTRRFAPGADPDSFTQVSSSAGVINFTGYNDFSDPWDYALPPTLAIGQVYGPGVGRVPLNPSGFAGRIYSARLELDCQQCPADLAPPAGTLNFFDVSAFLGAYNTQDPVADFAPPSGVFNFFDVSAFLAAYNAGCP